MGFAAVEKLAKKHKLRFRKQLKFKGSAAEGTIGENPVVILKPLTFMNLSGEAVALALHDLQIELSRFIVLVDDVAMPLGQLRIRVNSGSGGHNGLQNIEECLQTNRYTRLRIGIGDPETGDLTSHVLSRFSKKEKQLVPGVLERAVQAVEIWLDQGITSAMDFANKHPSTPSIGEGNE